MAYEMTIARLMVEHGPTHETVRHAEAFLRGMKEAAEGTDEQRRLISSAFRGLNSNAFAAGYLAFIDALGEVSDGV